jgi:hypothetical protein
MIAASGVEIVIPSAADDSTWSAPAAAPHVFVTAAIRTGR